MNEEMSPRTPKRVSQPKRLAPMPAMLEGCDSVNQQPDSGLAQRLIWLRSQLGRVLDNLEGVSNTLSSQPCPPSDQGVCTDLDVRGVLIDLERLANGLGETGARISDLVGKL